MVVTRTPFRASFVGGGSDIREYYVRQGHGAVVSAAIAHYMYVVVHPYFYDKIRVKYSQTEDVDSIDEIRHPVVRECLRRIPLNQGVEITSFADVPAGTGLGSSSSFTVGLLHALYAFKGILVSKERLAEEACEIEIDVLKDPIGKQDQYAAAFGGLNTICFYGDGSVKVSPIFLDPSLRALMESRLALYYTGGSRLAREILGEQKANLVREKNLEAQDRLVTMAHQLDEALREGNIDFLDTVLREGWQQKIRLASGICNPEIEALLDRAVALGASSGKLLGAGSQGFLLLHSSNHPKLAAMLGKKRLPFILDTLGTQVISRS
ncbi:MAG: GHMP kinase [Nitrospirae bacterium]|nr:GHMP kinase [Magnetococcales bacterium]